MTVVLDYWSRRWQSVAFDPGTGEGRIRWLSRKPSRCTGWAVKHAGVWYALWSNGVNVVFQAGECQLPMTDAYECRNARTGPSRMFTVEENGRVMLELTYEALDRNGDASFDQADLEQEDFFFYVSRLWKDPKWKHEVVKSWAS